MTDDDDLAIDMASTPQQRLPAELVNLVSSFLVDTCSLRTLSQLNQVSYLCQTQSTRHLFSTFVYRSTPSWLDTVEYGIPKGWAYTRNLLVTDTSYALLKHHLGVMLHRKIVDKASASNAFPKLELLAVTDAQGFTRLKIYKPMSLASIMERLDIDTYTQRSFYGTVWNRKEPTAFPTGFARSRLAKEEAIVALEFQNGAYLLPDDGSDEIGAGYCATQKLPAFRFEAHGPLPADPELANSGIVQFLKCYRRAQQHRPEAEEPVLALAISRKFFVLFMGAFHQTKLMPYRLSIKLTTECGFSFFRDGFAYLAGMYAASWSPRPIDPKRKLFVALNCVGAIVPASSAGTVDADAAAGSRGPAAENENKPIVQYGARLDLGHWGEADGDGHARHSERGFTASAAQITHVKGEASREVLAFLQVYPCNRAYEAV